jgi:hypothetical protein
MRRLLRGGYTSGRKMIKTDLTIGLIVLLLLTSYGLVAYSLQPSTSIVIQISNPYSFQVEAEVKCDWNNEKQAFSYHKHLVFPSDQITKIEIPKTQKLCEIWPKVRFFN